MSKSKSIETLISMYDPFLAIDQDKVYLRVYVHEDEEVFEVRADSSDGESLLKYFLFQMLGRAAKPAEVKEFQDVIRGAAMLRPRRELVNPLQELLEADMPLTPLAQVVDMIADRGGLRGENGFLLQRIADAGQRLGVADHENFPKTVDQLGTQLAALIPTMKVRSVLVERHDTARPREWTIHPRGYTPRPEGDEPTR